MSGMFNDYFELKEIKIDNFDISQVFDISSMLLYCRNLKSLNLFFSNTKNLKEMNYMFSNCQNLES